MSGPYHGNDRDVQRTSRDARPRHRLVSSLATVLLLALGGCAAATGPTGPTAVGSGSAARIQQCKAGDTPVPSESGCLQDDAACYALADGSFCTGERGSTCPAGSSAVPDGAACPSGGRCFRISESLECQVTVN